MSSLTLRKEEKLRHRSLVESLFKHGSTIRSYPLRAIWRVMDEKSLSQNFRDNVPDKVGQLQMLITVPKKKRKRAVDRVLLRRRIREAYRLHRLSLKKQVEGNEDIRLLCVAFIYLDSSNHPYSVIEKKMIKILGMIEEEITENKHQEA